MAATAVRSRVLQQVIAALLVCTALLVCVEADYRLEVQFIEMINPTGMCGDPRCADNQGCCDAPGQQSDPFPCRNQCAYHPRFCVRPLGTESNSTSDCLGELTIGNVGRNGDLQAFTTDGFAFFETPNPAVFTGPRWPGGIQLFMEVRDLDNGVDAELVDRFAVDANVSVGSDITINNTGVFDLMELTVNFNVTCMESFFVIDCVTCFGVNRDPSTSCSECLEGYGGSNCDVDLDPCGHTTPCENGATCNNTGPDQYECLCAAGFEGDSCERETNECDPNPCMNGGSCTDLLAGYSCSCAAGFEGDSCERETNECDPNPCMNGGSCTDRLAGYSCSCAAGFEGESCERETNECDPNPCMNGGTCIDLLAGYNCSCLGGFSGTNCEQEDGGDSGTPGTLLAPVLGGVAGGLLLLVMVLVAVVICQCLMMRQRKSTPAVLQGHTPPQEDINLKPNPVYGISTGHTPPQEDIHLKPNPVYGISTSHTPLQEDINLKPNPVYGISTSHTQEDIDLKPNPGYGMSVPQESQTNSDYYPLDHIHKPSGTETDVYDYVN